jgi:hypothetical protein
LHAHADGGDMKILWDNSRGKHGLLQLPPPTLLLPKQQQQV